MFNKCEKDRAPSFRSPCRNEWEGRGAGDVRRMSNSTDVRCLLGQDPIRTMTKTPWNLDPIRQRTRVVPQDRRKYKHKKVHILKIQEQQQIQKFQKECAP